MSQNGSAKKFLIAGVLVGVLFVVVRKLRGGGDEDEIDRIDTGNERNEDHVETGLDRVATDDEDDESADGDEAGSDDGDGAISVEATSGGRFDKLDLFDYAAILGAAFRAAKSEYDART